MLSGFVDNYTEAHKKRIDDEIIQMGGKSVEVDIKCFSVTKLLLENNLTNIDFLSIDVEGAEFAVIKSINFDNIFIDVIGFENNYNDLSYPIIEYLENKNFKILNNTMHDIFMIHKDSKFLTF